MKTITDFDRTRWLPCLNQSATDAPPFSALKVTGVSNEGILQIVQPDANNIDALIGGPATIPAGGNGICSRDSPIAVAYDTSQGTPAIGDVWSAQAGSWVLGKLGVTTEGFAVLGTLTPGIFLGSRRPQVGQRSYLSQAGSQTVDLTPGASVTLQWSLGDTRSYALGEFALASPTRLTIIERAGTGSSPPFRYFMGLISSLQEAHQISIYPGATLVAGASSFSNQAYYWTVVATTANGDLLPYGIFNGNGRGSVTATPSGSGQQVQLSWSAITQDDAGNPVTVTGYEIYRGTALGNENILVATVGSGVTSYTDTGGGTSGTPFHGYLQVNLLRNGSQLATWKYAGRFNDYTGYGQGPSWYFDTDGTDCVPGDYFEVSLTNQTNIEITGGGGGSVLLLAGNYR